MGSDITGGVSKVGQYDDDLSAFQGMTGLRDALVAQRYTVLADSIADGLATFWTTATANGGTAAVSSGEGLIQTSANATGSAQISSTTVPYYPGQQSWFNSAIRLGDTGSAGNIRRWGVFTVSGTTPQEGAYFELSGTTLNAVVVKGGTPTAVAVGSWTRNAQAPFTLDTNYHQWEIRYTSNSVWFYVDNVLRHVASGGATSITGSLNFPMTITTVNTSGATNRLIAVRNIGIGRFGEPNRPNVESLSTAPNTDTEIQAVGIGPGFDRKRDPANLGTAANSTSSIVVNGADYVAVYIGNSTTGTYAIELTADDTNWVTAQRVYDAAAAGELRQLVTGVTPTVGQVLVVQTTGWRQMRLRTVTTLGATMAHKFTAHAGQDANHASWLVGGSATAIGDGLAGVAQYYGRDHTVNSNPFGAAAFAFNGSTWDRIRGNTTGLREIGGIAHDAADTAANDPVMTGARAQNALPTAVANADVARAISDLFGRQLIAHIDPAMAVHKAVNVTTAQTGTDVWTPAAGKRIAVTSLIIASYGTTAGRVILWFGDNADTTYTAGTDQVLAAVSFAPSATAKPGLVYPPMSPVYCTTADRELHLTTDAAISLDITVEGYEY